MQRLADMIDEKALKYSGELFFADGQFFAIYDGKIAKLPDFTGDFDGIYRLRESTERFISSYIVINNLELGTLIDNISVFESELELYGDEIPSELDDESATLLKECMENGITPYSAYKAMVLLMAGVESGGWVLLGYDGEYCDALTYISEACEVIDFHYTDEYDDEYWQSIVENIESYLFSGGEIF